MIFENGDRVTDSHFILCIWGAIATLDFPVTHISSQSSIKATFLWKDILPREKLPFQSKSGICSAFSALSSEKWTFIRTTQWILYRWSFTEDISRQLFPIEGPPGRCWLWLLHLLMYCSIWEVPRNPGIFPQNFRRKNTGKVSLGSAIFFLRAEEQPKNSHFLCYII